jgi:CheY-like chemotaxis protein
VIAGRPAPIVLVADDDQDTRELYRACFDTNGYRTAEAGTGSQAIVAAVEIVPDVLLTDYVLPDIDGVTIARRLRDDVRTAAICMLMITGYANTELERAAAAAGIDRVFLKPCLPQTIMREVSRAMARPRRPGIRQVGGAIAPAAPPIQGHAVTRVRDEFAALPGLSLTTEQARLVFNLDRDTTERVLDTLVTEGFLSRTPRGTFTRPRA